MSRKILNVEHLDEDMDTEAEDDHDYDDNDITDVDGDDSDASRARSSSDKQRKPCKDGNGNDNSPLNALFELANKNFDLLNGEKNGKSIVFFISINCVIWCCMKYRLPIS
jgi:hypothetical protein